MTTALTPELISTRNPDPLSVASLEMLAYIEREGSATFAELQRVAQASGLSTGGRITIRHSPYAERNMISWADVSEGFVRAVDALSFDTDLVVTTQAHYLIKGHGMLILPVGKAHRKKPYVKLHWLPIALTLRKDAP